MATEINPTGSGGNMTDEGERKSPHPLLRLGRILFSALRDYVVNVRVKDEAAGFATLRVLARSGPLYWPGLAILLVSVAATAYLSLQSAGVSILSIEIWEGEAVRVLSAALYLSLFVISFGWAYLLVGAAAVGLGAYVLAAAYVAFYGLAAGFGLAGTPWFALIPFWLLVTGAWVASSRPTRWRLPLLCLLCYLVALITYSSLHLKTILPGNEGRLILAAVYLALVANPWTLRERAFKPSIAFAVSAILFVGFYGLNLLQTPAEEVLGDTFLSLHYLLGLVSLFWFWLGLDLFNGAQSLARWLVDTIKALVPSRILRLVIFSLWGIWIAIAYLLIHGPTLGMTQFLLHYRLGSALLMAYMSLEPSMVFASALDYHLYLTVAIVLLALALWLTKRLSAERLLGLFGLSVAGFLVLYGYFGIWFAFGSEDWESILGFWPLLIFVAGMFWEVLKASAGAVSGTRAQTSLYLSFLLLLGGISLLELPSGSRYFQQELSLNPLLGVQYLGLPYLLYTFLYKQRRYTPVAPSHLALLFALGMLSAIPSLIWAKIVFAPVAWLVVLLATVWRWGRWDELWDGLVYAIASALGFLVFYTHPVMIPIPAFTGFLGRFVQLQSRYAEHIIWPWEARWWVLLLAVLEAAVILGYLLSRARLAQGRARILFLILGLSLSLAFLAICEFAIVRVY